MQNRKSLPPKPRSSPAPRVRKSKGFKPGSRSVQEKLWPLVVGPSRCEVRNCIGKARLNRQRNAPFLPLRGYNISGIALINRCHDHCHPRRAKPRGSENGICWWVNQGQSRRGTPQRRFGACKPRVCFLIGADVPPQPIKANQATGIAWVTGARTPAFNRFQSIHLNQPLA